MPVTLNQFLKTNKDRSVKYVEGVQDTIGLVHEWIKSFENEIKELSPLGTKSLPVADELAIRIRGLKRIVGE